MKMSGLRDAIKSKLKSLGEKSGEKSPDEDIKKNQAVETEMKSVTHESDVKQTSSESLQPSDDVSYASDVASAGDDVQDIPVDQLQEQLLSVMIQNQELERSLQEQERIKKLYEHEKEKCKALEEQLREFVRQTSREARSKFETTEGFIDVAQEVQEEMDMSLKVESKSWRDRCHNWFLTSFHELIRDFTEEPDIDETIHDQQLAVKTLKTNITRFKEGTNPVFYTVRGFRSLFSWQYPVSTLAAFILYMYAVWIGWLLPLVLLLIITRLTFNYLNTRGWNVNINFLAAYEPPETENSESFSDMGVSDKFTVVMQVATKVQNALGYLADNLEKLWNLLTWQQREATIQIYVALCGAFVLSCFLPGTTFFKIAALYLGFKMFIIEFIYLRFPRFKQRHDSVHILWRNLPTNAQLQDQLHKQTISRKSIDRTIGVESQSVSNSNESLNEDSKVFCDVFSLPYTEIPLKDWQDGKGCALIDKEKGISLRAFKYGKLYLTNSFLCFERQKKQSPRNITIPMTDITSIKKVKPYSWMPGTGMSIEITTITCDKPYLFGAMLSRDEVFESIIAHGLSVDLAWASEAWDSRNVVSKSHDQRDNAKDKTDRDNESEEVGDTAEEEKEEKEMELRQRSFRMSDLQCEEDDT